MNRMRLAAILSAGLLGTHAYADDQGRRSNQNNNPAPAAADAKRLEVQALKELLVGEFDSSAQAAQDTDYFPITLRMVECWKERSDGPWLYVEQAMGNAQDKPYRQRVYRLLSSGVGRAKSEVYELPGTMDEVVLTFAGQWRSPRPLSDLMLEQLKVRQGCAILLTKQADGTWMGSTDGKVCTSTLRGASYATSEVVLSPGLLRTWDRGFDKDGKQVWGAKKGPYSFARQKTATTLAPVK